MLVIHGTGDQSLPVAHGEAFARDIAHSNLTLIDGMGHLPTRREWTTVSEMLIHHIANSA